MCHRYQLIGAIVDVFRDSSGLLRDQVILLVVGKYGIAPQFTGVGRPQAVLRVVGEELRVDSGAEVVGDRLRVGIAVVGVAPVEDALVLTLLRQLARILPSRVPN